METERRKMRTRNNYGNKHDNNIHSPKLMSLISSLKAVFLMINLLSVTSDSLFTPLSAILKSFFALAFKLELVD